MTAQVPEIQIFKGERLRMCATPLDAFLSQTSNKIESDSISSACWRGYVGVWEIINDRLYLKEINVDRWDPEPDSDAVDDEEQDCPVENVLGKIFPGYQDGVFAHWVTGKIRCPKGNLLKYFHGGYMSKFEEDLFLEFKAGVLVNEQIVINGKAPDDVE